MKTVNGSYGLYYNSFTIVIYDRKTITIKLNYNRKALTSVVNYYDRKLRSKLKRNLQP
jgi:hypothetical protein